MLVLLNLAVLVASVSSQSFSFGTSLGSSAHDVITPPFDSQRASPSSVPSSRRGSSSPPLTFSESFSQPRGFPFSLDDFSSSKFVESSRRSQPTVTPNQSSARTSNRADSTSRSQPTPRSASRSPTSSSRARTTSVNQESRGSHSTPAAEQDFSRVRSSPRSRTRTSSTDVAKSSRGRVQLKTANPSVTRPFSTTTPAPNVVDNLVGQSICPRGTFGDACRSHLKTTAMACSSGFCQECQQCGNLSEDLWPKCCREHFLCCRPLAKACQSCDKPLLQPFCNAAFGRCS